MGREHVLMVDYLQSMHDGPWEQVLGEEQGKSLLHPCLC